jgi:hypothetical protein
MKIEGLWQEEAVWLRDFQRKGETWYTSKILKPDNLEVGTEIVRWGGEWDINFIPSDKWIITEVLWDGKFKAVPKEIYNGLADEIKKDVSKYDIREVESFDISGKIDTNNPIYKFYENELQKYLKRFGSQRVTDDKGVSWFEVPIKEEYGKRPVQAFQSEKITYDQKNETIQFLNRRYEQIKWERDTIDIKKTPFTKEEFAVLSDYTIQTFWRINNLLRNPTIKRFDMDNIEIDVLKNALNKLPSEKKTVYRWITKSGYTKSGLDKIKVWETYTDKGIMSTSWSIKQIKPYSWSDWYTIEIQTNNAKDVSKFAALSWEEEFLIPPGLKFQVIKNEWNTITIREI